MQKVAEPRTAWPSNVAAKASTDVDDGGMPASPDLNAHRRSSSDIYSSSTSPYRSSPYRSSSSSSGGVYAVQNCASSCHSHRERRTRSWDLSADPELLRKRRLASYKVYGIEGKVKATVKRSLHWVKGKYNKLVYGCK